MAACTELEIEEKSSEESSCNAVHANDVAFQEADSKSRCHAACTTTSKKELGSQPKTESETSDLKELSDDEFLHLLKEASTFNKPNNQESILLKQLRKEVAETDSCEHVRCSESSCVSKRTDRKCSKISCGGTQSNIDSSVNHSSLTKSSNFNDTNSLPSRTLKTVVQKKDKESSSVETSMLLNPRERVTVIEVDASNHWMSKTRKTSAAGHSILEPLKTLCDSRKFGEQDMLSLGTTNRDSKSSASTGSYDSVPFNDAKSQLGLPVEFKLEVDPLPTLLIGNYDNFAREMRVPGNNSMSQQNSSKDSPAIELTEFKSSWETGGKKDEEKNSDASSSKGNANNQLSNSKFYVNCNDVDTTVTFPLKLVSSMDERNGGGGIICDAVSEQLKRQMGFPCFSWPRPQQVHSFLGSVPADNESHSQSETENNSNPFSRAARTANITSFVSATLLDYPNSALAPDNQTSKLEWSHRKHKRTRNHTENSTFILSQNIEGHRGNEDIDSLVKFIEAADKHDKTFSRGSNANHLFTNKTNPSQEALKKKVNGKETKNQNKNCYSSRKKVSQSNLDDNCIQLADNKQDSITIDSKMVNSESESSDDSGCNKVNKVASPGYVENMPVLDINSNIMEVDQNYDTAPENTLSSAEVYDSPSVRSVSPDSSGFAADFYAVTESVPQVTEESGFCIVKKKQRKKHQGKRSENYRWHSAAARVRQSTSGDHDYYSKDQSQHGSSMMLLSGSLGQRSQCSKQDSRRKSTSSVPQSEQSSADNSDLDSVHSLPVRGSAPHPTQPHPHTTPSSSSSTPQASYADIARMPVSSVSKLNPSANGGNVVVSMKSTSFSDKNCVSEMLSNDDKEIELPSPDNVKPNPSVDVCPTNNSFSLHRSTREINTQTEPLADENVTSKVSDDLEQNSSVCSNDSNKKVCPVCSLSGKGKVCACPKVQRHFVKRDSSERVHRPAVVMMGNIPTTEASDISFGIDLTEILEMSSGEVINAEGVTALASVDCSDFSCPLDREQSSMQHHSNGCNCNQFRVTHATQSSFDNGNLCKIDLNKHICALHKKVSSPRGELHLSSGQKLLFSDRELNMQRFNYIQVVDLFSREWKNIQSEYSSDVNKTEGKVKYYDENSC